MYHVILLICFNLAERYPVPHLALIYNDGRILDISLHENISATQQQILKLQKDIAYFGYSDEEGTLHFISSTLKRPITKYHPDHGHHTLKNSLPKMMRSQKYGLEHGLQLGNKFLVLGDQWKGSDFIMHFVVKEKVKTYIWYMKKEKWRRGPSIPVFFDNILSCTSINATAFMIIFNQHPLRSLIYDLKQATLYQYPVLNLSNIQGTGQFISQLSLTTIVTKTLRK